MDAQKNVQGTRVKVMIWYSDYLSYCRSTAMSGGRPISFGGWKKNQKK